MAGERPHLAQFFSDDTVDVADRSRALVSSAPVPRDGIAEIETFDGIGEVAHEIATAQLAVSEDFEAEFFLFCEDTQDVLILEGAQFFRVSRGLSCLEQVRRPQKTSHMISTIRCRHSR